MRSACASLRDVPIAPCSIPARIVFAFSSCAEILCEKAVVQGGRYYVNPACRLVATHSTHCFWLTRQKTESLFKEGFSYWSSPQWRLLSSCLWPSRLRCWPSWPRQKIVRISHNAQRDLCCCTFRFGARFCRVAHVLVVCQTRRVCQG
jgi:hypothetical protein